VPTKIEKDSVTGTETTGHEWDGLKELNTPLPKWWLYVMLATIVWGLVYMLLYPSVPLGRSYFSGLMGYSQRDEVTRDVADIHQRHSAAMSRIEALEFDQILKDPELKAVAMAAGRISFANNCQPCHGPSGAGRPENPNLADDEWLWGGKFADIQQTLLYGVRNGRTDARDSAMPKFGADGVLDAKQISQTTDYVLALAGRAPAGADLQPGELIFAENCAACHGEKGIGNREFGAPRLNDAIWLYGADRASIQRQIVNPRHGVMPAWVDRLDAATIKSLSLYVHAFGGGE
jgi:cytochrome c oxidase cbb3-type subunit 3